MTIRYDVIYHDDLGRRQSSSGQCNKLITAQHQVSAFITELNKNLKPSTIVVIYGFQAETGR